MEKSNSPANFAGHHRAVVVAPAGCGKTELIADSVKCYNGRQLVLTHTHAGVDSLRKRFNKKGIKSHYYNLETIHSFALKYSVAYPGTSELPCKKPMSKEDYPKVIEAARKLLKTPLAKEILLNSYSGVFVDEYQDCTVGQDRLIKQIAEVLPCRIVGDHMQGIFDFGENRIVDWDEDIYSYFEKLNDLSEPYRWKDKNRELGDWLLSVRACLKNKEPIELSGAPVAWYGQSPSNENKVLSSLFCVEGRVFVLCAPENPHKPHWLAKNQSNRYKTIEPITSDEICKSAASIENATGEARLDAVVEFADECLAKISGFKEIAKKLNSKYNPNAEQRKRLLGLCREIVEEATLEPILRLFDYIDKMYTPKPTHKRDQLWREMHKALHGVIHGNYANLEEGVWEVRNLYRFVGRRVPRRCISRTVLLKGLECEHGIVIDADSFDSKNLYVALTRASQSLTILSNTPVLVPKDYRAYPE